MSKEGFKIEASTTGKKGVIRIVDYISSYSNANSTVVREIVDDFIDKSIAETEVYINTYGGSVIEAQQIVYELGRLPKVTIQFGAVAASAGTYPATKFLTKAYPNSQIMIHKPKIKIEGNEDQVEADLTLIKNTTQDYRSSYAKKMGKTDGEIDALWQKGDYWMTGTQAKKEGLVDELIEEPLQISSEDHDRMVAAGCPNPPKISANTNTDTTMKNRNQIIAALKLPADATDEQVETAVKAAMEKADKVDTLTATRTEDLKKEAKTYVDKAVADKKITADVAEKWQDSYVKDKDTTVAMLEAIKPVEKPNPTDDAPSLDANREKWTLEDWQQKDLQGLNKMASENPEKFEKLNAEYFGN